MEIASLDASEDLGIASLDASEDLSIASLNASEDLSIVMLCFSYCVNGNSKSFMKDYEGNI